jgi:hypothetical protein
VILTGRRRGGAPTPGVDGVLDNGQLIQLKQVDSPNQTKIADRAKEAYKKAAEATKAFDPNIKDVDVHIVAGGFTKADALKAWQTYPLKPSAAELADGTLKRIVVHCKDGSIELPIR